MLLEILMQNPCEENLEQSKSEMVRGEGSLGVECPYLMARACLWGLGPLAPPDTGCKGKVTGAHGNMGLIKPPF